ncbi:carboxylating nicotinate-nucleotide diphosphorylase [Corynebacterium sp. zg254]|uniref:nicotinate-nucleotide diphosphorylase (carboxylating) n=1 Tax=Corynebacterium zhongnanshanii TaxID=2768834 RepID=A0ABQ6VCQ7_9CORY|nr:MULTISPECIES: carboxylating nicotinate-nucleotide diphosphorylase [Corynebacterium]KAB3519830.1 carboxylating nicotinate-nucleotide diphosphorylase [Corynebacterium zhongnanshanii]MCR5914762.1 carboxylating nicotinate-nucleotide diphosphorylase [Corynebacterium sp. zg254]
MLSPDTDAQLTHAGLDPEHVTALITAVLDEDLQWGEDVTTLATIPADQRCVAEVVARQDGVLAGVPVARAVAEIAAARDGSAVTVTGVLQDGDAVQPGSVVLRVEGRTQLVLTMERTLLNLLCQLSGVASATAAWVRALAGTGTRVRDTRKTQPLLRVLQKYAVRCGGGVNHRMGLGDAALIKDNHIEAAGSITAAFQAISAHASDLPIEVECDTVAQVSEAIDAGASLILLDNMSPTQVAECLALTTPASVATELSGGLTLDTIGDYSGLAVDYVAVGALTHSATVLDLGLDFR